jgi:hypothetical protein
MPPIYANAALMQDSKKEISTSVHFRLASSGQVYVLLRLQLLLYILTLPLLLEPLFSLQRGV